ncbi:MAG: grasp-with-spasm system ATP-grasp peptide maturase [Bacteroidia bacterium]
MILIISENKDYITDIVLDWLSYNERKFTRINDTDKFVISQIEIESGVENIKLFNSKFKINLSDVSVYWHRRGVLNLKQSVVSLNLEQNNNKGIGNYIQAEYKAINLFVEDYLYNKSGVGRIEDNYTNKLSNLIYAKNCGFIIPSTYILKNKKEVLDLIEKEDLITKGIQSGWFYNDGKEYSLFTSTINQSDLAVFPDKFEYSLIQKKLDKKYELRIFYFNERMFATAIFSQNDTQTETDFRHYNNLKPNRTPPFDLPLNIKEKIIKFMTFKKMKTGSIDIVITKKNEYVFLEVNPFGQFGQVSNPGNFHIEKHIANYLIERSIND